MWRQDLLYVETVANKSTKDSLPTTTQGRSHIWLVYIIYLTTTTTTTTMVMVRTDLEKNQVQ